MIPDPIPALQTLMDQPFWKIYTSVVATASALAAIIPNKEFKGIIKWARFLIDIVAFNWAGAKNESKGE